MPDLQFEIKKVSHAVRGVNPLLQFTIGITNSSPDRKVRAAIIQAQIQIQSVRRPYTDTEKEKLVDLFGEPERWGQTLRNRLWTQAHFSVNSFTETTEVAVSIPCTFDLNVATAKYFYGLEEGDVPLLFLFSGTLFYETVEGNLQIAQIPWETECTFSMPIALWQEMIDHHYPNKAWFYIQRDVFEQLYAYKRRNAIPTWDEVIARLVPADREVA